MPVARLIAAVLVLLPQAALACPVCVAAEERSIAAYLATTVFLSVLPLGMLGGIGLLVLRRARARREAVAAAPAAPARPELRLVRGSRS